MDQSRQPSARWGDLEPPSPPHTGIRAFSEDFAWQDIEQEHSSAISSADSTHGETTDTASSPTRSSRYANMGLNRIHPRSPRHTPDPRSRNTAKAAEPKKIESVRMKNCLKTIDDEEDLTGLEELMIPEELRSPSRQRVASSTSGWQPINKIKTSRYTTGILTESGWQSIDNPATADTLGDGMSTAHISAAQQGDIPNEVGSVIGPSPNPVDGEETEGKLEDIDDSPWLDDKYFDHYGYLNYTNNVKDSKDNDELDPAPEDKTDKKGVQLVFDDSLRKSTVPKKPLAAPRQPTKTPADVPEDTLMNNTNHPVRDTLEVDDEAKREASPESSSDETGKWELLEGNIDAPRTGNVSIHKLTIKLRNTATGESKTLTYTQVKHEDIDWASRPQIAAITQWRTDVFREHGLNTKKNMIMYTPLEDAWMTLFHRKLRAAIEAGHPVKIPGPVPVMEAFNAYFEGTALKDANGEDVRPRPARDAISIRGKLDGRASKIAKERKLMRELVKGKKGGAVFVPVVTEEDLREFQEDGTVVVDDLNEAGKKAASGGEGWKSRRSSPKRKREEKDAGERDAKKAKQISVGTQK